MAGMPFDLSTAKPVSPALPAFDPDAYLARKGVHGLSKPFDPDAYLASKSTTLSAPKPSEPEDKRSDNQRIVDMASMPGDMIGSAVRSTVAAPIANVAGMARAGWEALKGGSKGNGDAPIQTREGVRNAIAPPMQNPEVQKLLAPVGAVAAPVGRMLHSGADAVRGDAPGNSPRGMLANAAIEGVKQAPNFVGLYGAQQVPRIAAAAERGIGTLTGATSRAARGEAMTATRGALSDVERAHAAAHVGKMSEAQAYEDAAARAEAHLKAATQRTGTPTVDAIGGQVRDDFLKVMSDAKAARAQEVEPLYAKAKASAAAREAQGHYVDVRPALTDIDAMLKDSEHLPDLQRELLRLKGSVQGAAPKGVSPPEMSIVDANGRPLTGPMKAAAPARPLSYAQLDNSVRFIKDIAFSGEAEGYGALIRNTAKKLSAKLDEQISKAVPEHAAATAKYRELSEPMETLSTRIGSALHDTEGGLRGDAYAKVSPQDIPARVFSKRDRVEQLVDALAGGKNATPQARAAAQAKVDTWVENWILDSTRGKVGAEAAKEIAAPGMRATLNAAPGARDRLAGTFGREAAHAARVPELGKAADASRAEAHAIQTQRVKVRAQIERADVDLAHGSQDAAYKGYVSALRASMATADPEKYRAAIALIERAGTLEAKTEKAQRLAKHFVYGATAAAGFNEVRKVLQ